VEEKCLLPNEVPDNITYSNTWLKCESLQNSTCDVYILNTTQNSAVIEVTFFYVNYSL
jgi:hypothetical protein